MGAGHGHDGTEHHYRTPKRIRRYVLAFLVPLVVITLGGMVWLWPGEDLPTLGGDVEYVSGTILELRPCEPAQPDCVIALATVDEGPEAGAIASFTMSTGEGQPNLEPGTAVWLTEMVADGTPTYGFSDVKRVESLFLLAALFSLSVIVLSRWKGVAALAGLGSSILILAVFVLPAILLGSNPLAVAAVGAAAIAMASMGLAHGFNMRTAVALVGTVFALLLTAVLGVVFTNALSFTGVGTEDAWNLQNSSLDLAIDFKGLFLAGLVIGALGVLDDVTVTQAAAVWEVRRANPMSSIGELYAAGMRVGRDHVSATVNTLVLAYIGAAMPLFLILVLTFNRLGQSINSELIAAEIVRSLVGGLGIISAIPITTILAAWVLTRTHEDISTDGRDDPLEQPTT